jgi:hypothetical protein
MHAWQSAWENARVAIFMGECTSGNLHGRMHAWQSAWENARMAICRGAAAAAAAAAAAGGVCAWVPVGLHA